MTTRVQTRWHGGSLRFIQDNGRAIDHASEFQYNGRQYNFLGGFYYNLETNLIKYIFKE